MSAEKFGQFESEKTADEKHTCRQICRELSRFGINERQRLFLIYLLSLELENIEHMRSISTLVRDLGGSDIFLTDRAEKEENG